MDEDTTYKVFLTLSVADLSFNKGNLTSQAQGIQRQIFSKDLDQIMDIYRKKNVSSDDAIDAIEDSVSDTSNTIQDLLNTVLANYEKKS